MKKNDVLLTEKEYSDAYMKAVQGKLNTASILRIIEGHDAQKKAQCLKLLAFMRKNYQLPKDTIIYPNLLVMSGQQVDELEKLLKES